MNFNENNNNSTNGAINVMIQLVPESLKKTIDNVFYRIFRNYNNNSNLMRVYDDAIIEKFRTEIHEYLTDIPLSELIQPKFRVLLSALETSRYCLEDDIVRKMFAKLIASSAQTTKCERIHPSFPSIIGSMSPLDAENLPCFKTDNVLPVAAYYYSTTPAVGMMRNAMKPVFLSNTQSRSVEDQSESIVCLERLGIIEIQYDKSITDSGVYTPFYQHDYYRMLCDNLNKRDDLKQFDRVFVQEGVANLTSFGEKFIAVCCE